MSSLSNNLTHKLLKDSFFKFFWSPCVAKDFKVNVSRNEKMSGTTGIWTQGLWHEEREVNH